ncbi:hypothetical protein F511_39254 [Dorcoceras hygrometricum]|uniref:Uncharacterized protein n=1 Tax=Dorcoceras hygrometricum TaxID=472368 RepID=A0A2Z7CQA5_9LAMI|nr:hypothetical protein F511_39254 [Dorcoceras hygrometricum]
MRTRGDKRPSRKNDHKVLMAEESTKTWADTDSDSSSSSSSSDSEQEEVHCLMADQTSDDEVFDFSNVEFTREDLVSALKDMVKDESSEGETSTQSQLVYDKFNKMSFVKANVIYDPCESMTYNDQTSPKLNHQGKVGIGFQRPENSKPSWLKNKLDKDKVKAGSKSFVPNQPRRNSTKAASTKRPATDDAVAPVVKKKRTTKSKSVSSKDTLDIFPVAQDAVPLQMVAPTPVAPVEQPSVPKWKTQKRKRKLILSPDDEIVDSETATAELAESILGGIFVEQGPAAESVEERENEPVVESTAEVLQTKSADDVDFIFQQVVTETAQLETDEGKLFDEPDVNRATTEDQAVEKADEVERWFDLPYEVLIAGNTKQMVTTARIQLAVGPQPLWLRNHNFGLVHRIMVKRLATSPHDPLGITDSVCKNQLVVVSIQYGPFNPYIPIRSTTIDKSRVAIDPIAMHTSWRSNSDIASVTRVSMTFRVVRTNQYNKDLGLIHSTNGNHLESPNEGSSMDHQVTIYLHAQNITMFPTNETWLLKFEVSNSTFVLNKRKIISIFLPNSVSSLIISEAVMPKRGKVVAAAPNHLLTIKVDPAGEMMAVALGKVVAEVEVVVEVIGVDLPREYIPAVVVDRSEDRLKIG